MILREKAEGFLIPNKDPRQALLSQPAMRAIMKTWTRKMVQVFALIARLPPQVGNGMVEARMNVWGFVFALDALRNNAPAIQVLLEVANTFTERPKREEVFAIVDRLLAFKVEVKTSLKTMRPSRPARRRPERSASKGETKCP
jgi:hypothetical protein